MNEPKTAVYLSKSECALFVLLAKSKALDVKEGSVEVFFTQNTPVKVRVSEYTNTGLDKADFPILVAL